LKGFPHRLKVLQPPPVSVTITGMDTLARVDQALSEKQV